MSFLELDVDRRSCDLDYVSYVWHKFSF